MNCDTCFDDWICQCEENSIIINTRLMPGITYYWQIVDKFDHIYTGSVVAESDGTLQIPISQLPEGLFTPYSGYFNLSFSESLSCGNISIPLTKKYDCIRMAVKGGNSTKNTIGCEVPCGSSTGETIIIPFTDSEEITVDWSLYSSVAGNNPLIQVYHQVEPNVYQLASVAVQQVRVNNVLTEIVVNNAGIATGYILITP